MPVEERELTIFVDLDGTQNRVSRICNVPVPVFSVGTMVSLLCRDFSVPPTKRPLREVVVRGGLMERLNIWFHGTRPLTDDSEQGLRALADMRDTFRNMGKEIRIEVLTGRQPYLHGLTHRQLRPRTEGIYRYFDDVRLNTFDTSTGFKEIEIEIEVGKGRNVVLIDDDEMASQKAARVQNLCQPGQKVEVFEIANISNCNWLLRHARVERPDNMTRVSRFSQAAIMIRQMVYSGRL